MLQQEGQLEKKQSCPCQESHLSKISSVSTYGYIPEEKNVAFMKITDFQTNQRKTTPSQMKPDTFD